MKNSILKKLASYSTLAASILVQEKSKAQIIYTNIKNDVIRQEDKCHQYDINMDGYYDFKISHIGYPIEIGWNVDGPYFNWQFIGRTCTSSADQATALDKGDPINNKQNWRLIAYFAFCSDSEPILNFEDIICGRFARCDNPWKSDTIKYIGLRLVDGRDSYYGWMRMRASNDCDHAIIYDYAFDTKANEPILAGQKSDDHQNKMVSDDVLTDFDSNITIISANKSVLIDGNVLHDHLDITIFSLVGTLKKQVRSSDETTTVYLQDLSPGLYIVKVDDGKRMKTEKVMIE